MSNLFKQQFVVNLQEEKRIINADERYVQKSNQPNVIKQSPFPSFEENKVPGSEEILDGFLAGLEAQEVIPEPQIVPEELIEQAQAEAEVILATARAEAIKIADEAQLEAQILYEHEKTRGYREGSAAGIEELNAERRQLQAEYEEMQKALQAEHDEKLAVMEHDIIDAVVLVFRQVFGVQFEDKKEILMYLVHNTLMHIEVGGSFRIRVSGEEYAFVEEHVEDIQNKIGKDVNVEVINDMSLESGDCRIETDYGIFDCGIETELDNLLKDIKSLCI